MIEFFKLVDTVLYCLAVLPAAGFIFMGYLMLREDT